jgi:phosphoribosylamine--glycine ligase
VLVLGSGAREHALAWKLAQNPTVDKIVAAPGNGGIAAIAECVSIDPADREAVAAFAESNGIDLTVIGPEQPLVDGVADELMQRGMMVFGPTRAGARIEASKSWAKELMERAGVPTARSGSFRTVGESLVFLESLHAPYVVKADGLAAGKGVLICEDAIEAEKAIRACLQDRTFGEAGSTIVIEEFLNGAELSVFGITDGRDVLQLVEARDFKRAFDGDEGPNTGGMGAFSPVPDGTAHTASLNETVFAPIVRALESEGIRYVGVLYAGLMLTDQGPKVLEFNARFGDPETQVVIPRLASDLGELLLACCEGNLGYYKPVWRSEACVGVVVASARYPDSSPTGFAIGGLDDAASMDDVHVFHAGTRREADRVVTNGGRVLTVSALGGTIADARDRAYEAADRISFEGARMRRDIAAAAAGRG